MPKSLIFRTLRTFGVLILLFLSHTAFAGCNGWFNFGACEVTVPYCSDGKCTIEKGVDTVGKAVNGLITKVPLSTYAQNIVTYLLSFVSIVAVIYIIYAGFQILIGGGDEEKVKKAKNIILYVIVGIVLMWLSYSIVLWIMKLIAVKNP